MSLLRKGFGIWLSGFVLIAAAGNAAADETAPAPAPCAPLARPDWLPRYDVTMQMDLARHHVLVHMRTTWTNRHSCPAKELVFNAHSHYQIPKDQVLMMAKTLEILRMAPSEGLDVEGHALEVKGAHIGDLPLETRFEGDTNTALVIPLPQPVGQGETVVVDLDMVMHLPQKQGRWGQWEGVTYLSNWLPVLAYYDEKGWQPTPFIPWHQPFFNEAAVYTARVVLPCDQKVACTGTITGTHTLSDGYYQVDITADGVRDFAFLCSARYEEFTSQVGPVRLHCLAFPEHEHYAKEMLRIAGEAITAYSQWFGPYPWPDYTIAESYFGWNGNECATLIMIDARVFGMPHIGKGYVEYLVSHETCHQWWYNLIGTNGYCETWMDEAMANYFAHRLMNQKFGYNNNIIEYPSGLEWLPNIGRENYRYYTMYSVYGRGEQKPCVQPMNQYLHLVNLFGMVYDKGGKIVGMIENSMDEASFLDFLHRIYLRYGFKMLRVADFQHELEEYTGKPWGEFFDRWLYKCGMTDWAIDKVKVEPQVAAADRSKGWASDFLSALNTPVGCKQQPCKVTVLLEQKAEYDEPTTLGISLDEGKGRKGRDTRLCPCQIRIPIMPQVPLLQLDDPPTTVEMLPGHRVRVEVMLPSRPVQIAVDPDQVLVDRDPSNNFWKSPVRWRITPIYSFLEESDLATAYDRWNVILGPWFYGPLYNDPWYTRSTMIGARAGLYRTQEFSGGVYAAYRSDFNDIVVGADALVDHWPFPKTQVGANFEQRVAGSDHEAANPNRAAVFGRYVITPGASLYLPPMQYAELFGAYTENFLPFPSTVEPGGVRFENQTTAGLHYHLNLLTPYWDPEEGFQLDATYAGGVVKLRADQGLNLFTAQLAGVQKIPDVSCWVEENGGQVGQWVSPFFKWLGDTRLAARAYVAGGLPDQGEYFPLGGSQLYRGFDLEQRQGSLVWVGSLEWRVPIIKDVKVDALDHVIGVRNIYGAAFYDVGDAYVKGQSIGPVAHALGAGLRLDVTWFGFVERTSIRLDVAKTVNESTPAQFWFGIVQPF
jgi:hypothetical protein